MASFRLQRELARSELEQLGIHAQKIFPVEHRLLGLIGIQLKPAFYASFASNFFVFTLSNTLLFFLLFNLASSRWAEYSALELGQSALFLGSLIGATIARLYQLGFRRHDLKSWQELGAILDVKTK